jgi:carboxylesterase type B
LQWGTANELPRAVTPLLSKTAMEAIIVMPAYRLNLFGYLASKELQSEAEKDGQAAGNMGYVY